MYKIINNSKVIETANLHNSLNKFTYNLDNTPQVFSLKTLRDNAYVLVFSGVYLFKIFLLQRTRHQIDEHLFVRRSSGYYLPRFLWEQGWCSRVRSFFFADLVQSMVPVFVYGVTRSSPGW